MKAKNHRQILTLIKGFEDFCSGGVADCFSMPISSLQGPFYFRGKQWD